MTPAKLRVLVSGLLVLCLASLIWPDVNIYRWNWGEGFGLSTLVALSGAWACAVWLWEDRFTAFMLTRISYVQLTSVIGIARWLAKKTWWLAALWLFGYTIGLTQNKDAEDLGFAFLFMGFVVMICHAVFQSSAREAADKQLIQDLQDAREAQAISQMSEAQSRIKNERGPILPNATSEGLDQARQTMRKG
jgi:hypothetical protein